MGRWAQKVWVIEAPEPDSSEPDRWAILSETGLQSGRTGFPPQAAEKAAPRSSGAGTGKKSENEDAPRTEVSAARREKVRAAATVWRGRATDWRGRATEGWGPTILAYLLGPLAVTLWLKGERRSPWGVIGIGSFMAGVLLLLFQSSFAGFLERVPHGGLVWLGIVPGVILLAGLAWSRSVAAVVCRRRFDSLSLPARMKDPRLVIASGLLVPGLGMLLAGHPKRAACAFWIVGPLAAGIAVLHRWRWLWEQSRPVTWPGSSATSMEAAFLLAAGVAVGLTLLWIVQALDGGRLAAQAWPRSRSRADTVSLALLISLILLAITHPPTSLARNLHVASVSLRLDGFRLIPLVLCEAAARLDPIEPKYLAQAAELDAALGREDEARSKREIVAQRLEQYVWAASQDEEAGRATLARLCAIHLPPRPFDRQESGRDGTWSRVMRLYE